MTGHISIDVQLEGGAVISEVEIDKQLTGRRAAKPGFIECSFPTIAGAVHASMVPQLRSVRVQRQCTASG